MTVQPIGVPPRRVIFLGSLALVVILTVVVTAIVMLTSGDAPVDTGPRSDPRTGAVTAAGLELRHPVGAVLTVPAGSLPVGTQVTIDVATPDRVAGLGVLQPDGTAWTITSSAQPQSPSTLAIPYDPTLVPPGARPLVGTFDEASGVWLPWATSADPGGRLLTAEIPTFSTVTWLLDRAGELSGTGVASWAEYQSGRSWGAPATTPTCAARPAWITAVTTVPAADAPLRACVDAVDGGFEVKAVGDRAYPVAVEFDSPYTGVAVAALDEATAATLNRIVEGTGGRRVFLLPSGAATVRFTPLPFGSGRMEGRVRPDASAVVAWLALEATRLAGSDLVGPDGKRREGWAATCAVTAIGSSGRIDTAMVDQALQSMTTCLTDAVRDALQQWDVDADAAALWRAPAPADGARRAVAALRWLTALDDSGWRQTVTSLLVEDRGPAADLIDVAVEWGVPGGALPDTAVALHTLTPDVAADGPSGYRVSTRAGGRLYRESTAAWIGCADTAATLTYHLDRAYRRLTATVGLRDSAPGGLSARVAFVADGRDLTAVQVGAGRTAWVDLDLTGVETLTVTALRTSGTCGGSAPAYGVLGDAALVPTAVGALRGTWSGTVDLGSGPTPVTITIAPPGGDGPLGTTDYPALGCAGTLTAASDADAVVAVEQVTTGDCATGAHLVLRLESGQLTVAYHADADTSGDPLTTVTLSRG